MSSGSRSRAELAARAARGPARRRAGAPRSTSTAAPTPPCSSRSTSTRTGELHAVFTRRRDDLRRHAGEISFPGGRRDADEADLRDTALREAHEEIGLPPDDVELVGALQPTPTIATNYAVYPFVGLIEPGLRVGDLRRARSKRCSSCRSPTCEAGYGRRRLLRRGVPFRTDVYVVGDDLIWGATARMLGDLLDRLDALATDAA